MSFVYSNFDAPLEGMGITQMSGNTIVDLVGISNPISKNSSRKKDKELEEAESKFLSAIFDPTGCRASCKEKLGGKGEGFKACLRECKGKGISKSKLKEMEAQTDATIAESLKNISNQRTSQEQDKNKYVWIIASSIAILLIIIGGFFIFKSQEN